ncbi:TetR/AcrR family transcriptional regulator [Kribbella kalugense]|nr:TetR/AcrR family transcriptional regulator [Kribbella kalugense]
MSPRKSVVEAAATRTRIIERALTLGSVDGLEGLTIGHLATDLGMSKAGVIGHFGTKEALQLAVVDEAVERFRLRVPGHALGARPGIERLTRAFEEWIDYMTGDEEHRGCFLTSVAMEYDERPGPIRDAILTALSRWSDYVTAELNEAVKAGELPHNTDVPQLTFELGGIALAVQQAILLTRDPTAATRGRQAIHRLLDHTNTHGGD